MSDRDRGFPAIRIIGPAVGEYVRRDSRRSAGLQVGAYHLCLDLARSEAELGPCQVEARQYLHAERSGTRRPWRDVADEVGTADRS